MSTRHDPSTNKGQPRSKGEILADLQELIRQQKQTTRIRIQICRCHYEMYQRLSSEKGSSAEAEYNLWCIKEFRYQPTWARMLRVIGEHIPLSLVRYRYFDYHALYEIAMADAIYLKTLLRHGSNRTADQLRDALLVTADPKLRTDEERIAALAHRLTAQEGAPAGRTTAGKTRTRKAAANGQAGTREERDAELLAAMLERETRLMDRLEKLYARGKMLPSAVEQRLGLAFKIRDAHAERFLPRIQSFSVADPRKLRREPDPAFIDPETGLDPVGPILDQQREQRSAEAAARARAEHEAKQATAAAPSPDQPGAAAPPAPASRAARPADNPIQTAGSPAQTADTRPQQPQAPAGKAAAAAAIRPPLYNQHHFALPVPYPYFDDEPTEADRLTGSLIVAFSEFDRLSGEAYRLFEQDGVPALNRLQARCVHEFHRCAQQRLEIPPLVQPFADQGLMDLQEGLKQHRKDHPALQLEDLFPLCISPALAATLTPMAWVVYDATPPFPVPDANPLEKLLFRLLGLTRYLCDGFARWQELYQDEAGHTHTLAHQFLVTLKRYGGHTGRFLKSFYQGRLLGEQEEAQAGLEQAQLAAQREHAKRYIVTVGDPSLPERWVIIGRLGDGRHVAVSTARPHLILLVGNGGTGKTHLIRLLSEGSVLGLSGLSQIGSEPARVLDFCADWTAGQANHAALNGLLPNLNPAAHQRLRDHFGADTSNVAYSPLELFCLPKTAPSYRALYPELVERGLQPIEVVFHDQELNHFNLSVLAGLAGARYKTRAHELFDSLVAQYGPELTLLKLMDKVDKSDLDSRSKGRILRQLQPILKMRSETEWMIDHMESPAFKAVILESEWLPMDMLVPVDVAMMNALCRVLRSGKDPLRIYALDEMLKFLACPGMMRFLEMLGAELRHRPLTMVLAAQRATGLPRRLVPLGTIFGTFHMSNPAEFRRWQGQIGALCGVSYEERIKPMQPRQVLLVGLEGSDPLVMDQGLLVDLRDTAIEPGGRTIRTG